MNKINMNRSFGTMEALSTRKRTCSLDCYSSRRRDLRPSRAEQSFKQLQWTQKELGRQYWKFLRIQGAIHDLAGDWLHQYVFWIRTLIWLRLVTWFSSFSWLFEQLEFEARKT
jgi:hypothetical protein